ncbi:2-succinyl-5-enolpyruvyl-6-hydroxy-3-cyclohexene-1-carboxylic-acid synthase [Bacteroidota bacterium]
MQQHVFTIAKVCQEFGVEEAVICPGSRSAPLVYAFLKQPGIKCSSVVDERSAGFIALGKAQQYQKPVVLICTSGTALLNFFPAIAEAFYQKVPLLVLSADRPPELLNQQDGQMIMQKNVYGKHVNGSHELLCFEEGKVDFQLTERIVLTALYETILSSGAGPVHINVPLREPLYPEQIQSAIPRLHQFKDIGHTPLPLPTQVLDEVKQAWYSTYRKLIIVGQMPPDEGLSITLKRLQEQPDVAIIADVVSNQCHSATVPGFDALIQYADENRLKDLEPDFIFSLGGPLVSKALKNWLKQLKPLYHFRLGPEKTGINTYQNLTHFIRCKPKDFLNAVIAITRKPAAAPEFYASVWKAYHEKTTTAQRNWFGKTGWCEPLAVNLILAQLGKNHSLQLANSGTVRYVSWMCGMSEGIEVYSNRGTSGIDGTVSTAIGAASAKPEKTHVLIVGDLSLLYDRNAFWIKELPHNLRIVVLNNGGGKIFEWIEGPTKHADYLEWFTTPHHRNLKNLSDDFGFAHYICSNPNELQHRLGSFLDAEAGFGLLELQFNNQANIAAIREFKSLTIN